MKVAFLDRDGTIIKDYPDESWRNIEEPEFFDDSIEFLQNIQELGYQIVFISNQYLINQGIISEEQFLKVNDLFLEKLAEYKINVLKFSYCPHTDMDNCNCKKPKTGMIDEVIKEFPEIDLKHSFYVGDSIVDVELAEKFSLRIFHISDKIVRENKKYRQVSKLSDTLNWINNQVVKYI